MNGAMAVGEVDRSKACEEFDFLFRVSRWMYAEVFERREYLQVSF